RRADMGNVAELRVACVLDEPAMPDLRVGEHLAVIVDWAARHAAGFEHADPMLGRAGREYRLHLGFQRWAVLHARLVRREARVAGPFRMAKRGGAALPDRLAGGADHQIAVLGPHPLIGRVLAMPRAFAR